MTLTKKIIIYVSILGLFPIILITLLYFIYFQPNIKSLVNKNIKAITEVVGDDIYRSVLESVKAVTVLSKNDVITNPDFHKKELYYEINNTMDIHNIFKDITYLDINGDVIVSNNYQFRELASTIWFKKALNREIVVSDVHAVLHPYEIIMTISCPVFDKNDNVIGVLVGHVDMDILNKTIKDTEERTGYEISLIDSNGVSIFGSDDRSLLEKFPDENIVNSAKNNTYYTSVSYNETEEVLYSLTPIKKRSAQLKLNWNILVVEDTNTLYMSLRRFKQFFFIIGFCSLLFFLFIAAYLSKNFKDRISKLKEVTLKLGEGDFSAEITDSGDDEVSELIRVFSDTRDILKDSEEKIVKANERFKLAVKGAKDVIWDWDIIDDYMYIGHKFWDLIGEEPGDKEHITMGYYKDIIHIEDRTYFSNQLNSYFKGDDDHFEVEYRIVRRDGLIKWIVTRGLVVKNVHGVNVRMAGSHTDITARKIMEQKMAFNAYYDTLTELPNRNMLLDRLTEALSRASRYENFSFSLLFLDFDGFKHINDTYGHDVGDQLLIDIGSRLKECIRPLDIVARIGGDEFVILIDDVSSENELIPILNRIIITSKNEFVVKEKSIFTSVSIGVAIERDGTSKPEELIQESDIAMYHSKLTGKSRFTFFTEELRKEEITRWSLEHELHKALGSTELQVYYQPIIETNTGKISSFEALMRWEHPEKGMISPVDFIPAAEDTGFITNMTKWLINSICHQIRRWEDRGYDIRVSFNVTAKDFFIKGGLDRFIYMIIKESRCKPRNLALEVTETVMIKDFENVTKQLHKLRRMGLAIKLDDFGTGYSSLSYLNKFEIDYIKIDKSFIQSITEDTLSRKIVKSIISLASDVKLKTVAEGVEILEERDLLKEWGCDYLQGYFYSRPLNLIEAEAFLLREFGY